MKKAYTLSEVLGVLLVLGIIAAFIIPAVMRTAPDRAALLYKKTFYTLQEACQKLINDETLYPVNPRVEDENGEVQPERNGLFTDAPALAGYGPTEQGKYLCENLARTLNTVGQINCDSAGSDGQPNFTTTNGVRWWNVAGNNFPGDSGRSKYEDISVQCNGTTFNIRIYNDGKVATGADGERLWQTGAGENEHAINGDNWARENKILRSPFKFRDL